MDERFTEHLAPELASVPGTSASRDAQSGIKTTCPYCGVGCGVIVTTHPDGTINTTGDPDHPANFGRLCSKGSALFETVGLEGRLLEPRIEGVPSTWEQAIGRIAGDFKRIIATHGPQAVAFYLSGQLLSEDYYAANKLAKGFIGTPHVDTNSRLCMASSVAGHRRAFGADIVPQSYEDLDCADLIVLVGSNAAWCHPILYQRMQANRARRGAKLVNIDVRRTATSEGADLELTIKPGSDTLLWAGLLVWLADRELIDVGFIASHVSGASDAIGNARVIAPGIEAVAAATGLTPDKVSTFYELFGQTARTLTCYSQGVNQSAQGTDKVAAILNVHLATGRIGRPGSGPLSLTGQPNAMGGREVGGLANMLAAHMNFSAQERERVAGFWSAPNLVTGEGLKAVQMFDAIRDGRIKALWVMHTNPLATLPNADRVREAMAGLELLVVSEAMMAPAQVSMAHVALPASAWGEKDGTVTNSERRISRQRPFRQSPGLARPDWQHIVDVAKAMGYLGFDWSGPAEVFAEHAALSSLDNNGSRPFDLSGLNRLDQGGYDGLEPVQWPVNADHPNGRARLFADGRFATADGRAKMQTVAAPVLAHPVSESYPLRLDTGRVRDQWHTMTRTGLSARLGGHKPEAFVEVSRQDCERYAIADGGLARITSAWGSVILRAVRSDDLPEGLIFAPFHWSEANQSDARVGAVVHPYTDPISGQPEMKATPVRIAPVVVALEGLYISRHDTAPEGVSYWSRRTISGGFAFAVTIETSSRSLETIIDDLIGSAGPRFVDGARNEARAASIKDGRLDRVLFLSPKRVSNAYVESLLAIEALSASERRALLAGRASDAVDTGPIVCACFAVGLITIQNAIVSQDLSSADEIGRALKAGTNCGSCVPELKKLLAVAHHA